MKVVLATVGADRYLGIAKYYLFLARHLALNGIDVELILDSPPPPELKFDGVTYTVIGPTTGGRLNISRTAQFGQNVADYLNDRQFDILHTTHVIPYLYLKRKNRKPVVFQPFGNELFTLAGKGLNKWYCKSFQWVLRSCGEKSDVLVMEGEFQRSEYEHIYHRNDMAILPVGIDIDYMKDSVKGFARHNNDFTVLAVNSLYKYERMDLVIKAFSWLPGNIPNVKLIIVGSGPERQSLCTLCDKLDLGEDEALLLYTVSEEELYKLYLSSDVFVSTSQEKDFLMSILEAEAFGLPIVSTGQKWLIDGNGFVVDPTEIYLANAIFWVYEGDKEGMGRKSKEIVQQYDFGEIAKQAIKIYEEALLG